MLYVYTRRAPTTWWEGCGMDAYTFDLCVHKDLVQQASVACDVNGIHGMSFRYVICTVLYF